MGSVTGQSINISINYYNIHCVLWLSTVARGWLKSGGRRGNVHKGF